MKSYARFKRLLPTQQAKSFARSYIARHLAMLATCQMHFLTLHASKTEAHECGNALPENRTLLVHFILLVFLFALFLERRACWRR